MPKLATPSLQDMQVWLKWIFTDPRGVRAALQSETPTKNEPVPRLLPFVAEDAQLPLTSRLGVYSNAYFVRLLEALGSNFPAVKRANGDHPFRELVARFLEKNPSTSPNIEDLGRSFSEFVCSDSVARQISFLSDLVRLEWTVMESLYADRLPTPDAKSLAGIAPTEWERARLVLDPTVRILKVRYSVEKIWIHRFDVESMDDSLSLEENVHEILVYRDSIWVQVQSLEAAAAYALHLIEKGELLGGICEKTAENYSGQGATLPIGTWFSNWIASGVVKRIEFDEPRS